MAAPFAKMLFTKIGAFPPAGLSLVVMLNPKPSAPVELKQKCMKAAHLHTTEILDFANENCNVHTVNKRSSLNYACSRNESGSKVNSLLDKPSTLFIHS